MISEVGIGVSFRASPVWVPALSDGSAAMSTEDVRWTAQAMAALIRSRCVLNRNGFRRIVDRDHKTAKEAGMADRENLQAEIERLDALIREAESRLGAHSVKPVLMEQLFELEEKRDALRRKLASLQDEDSPEAGR
jgi:hypothetical protein